MKTTIYKTKFWKRILSIILAIIIGFGTFVAMLVGNIFLSDYLGLHNIIVAEASDESQIIYYYRYDELVVLFKSDYTYQSNIQYKIGEDGEWQVYTRPFSVPAYETTRVYARFGDNGEIGYFDCSTKNNVVGVYFETETDFSLTNNGISFDYSRTYDSVKKKWSNSLNSNVNIGNGYAILTFLNGRKYCLVQTDEITYKDALDDNLVLKKQNNEYVLTTYDTDYYYSPYSNRYYLSKIGDKFGNEVVLNREVDLYNYTISDNNGHSFSIEESVDYFDTTYLERTIIDPNGNAIKYVIDSNVKDEQFLSVIDQSDAILNTYSYSGSLLTNSNSNAIEYYDDGRLKKITYQNGSWIQYTYNDDLMNYTTLTSSGETTKTVYDDTFYPVEYTDEYGEITTYTYDDKYRVKTETVDSKTTTYTYDSYGNILSYVTDDSEDNTYYTYNSDNKVIREQIGDSYTYYTYDANGNNLVYATLKEDYTGEIPAQYDSALTCFDTTTYTYDEHGRVTNEVYSTGGSASYTYDNVGNVLTQTTVDENNDSKTVTYTYDAMGNLLTSSSGNDTSSYVYDEAGRTLLANENGECTRTVYDNHGRVVQEIAPEDYDSTKDGLPTSKVYNDSNVGHRYFYNEDTGNLDREINRLGVETTYEYFSTGEKKKETFDIYVYEYNIKGNLTKVYVDGVNTVSYNYNESYQLTSEVYANGQSIRYEYDDDNNLVRQFHNNDTSAYVTYSYNEDNELVQKINTDTGLKYVYGENDSVSVYRISDNTLVQSYSETITAADEENDVEARTDITETHFGTTYSSVIKHNSISYTTGNNTAEYSYTENDNLISEDYVKYNNNTSISSVYEYDSNNNITSKEMLYVDSISVENTYDNENRIASTGYNSPQIYYTYDDNGQLIRSDDPVLKTSTFTYDDRGNILSRNKYSYTRNEITSNPIETTTFAYSNDGWNDKLISVNGTPLTYDANGNVLTYGDKSFTWSSGRNLAQVTDGDNTYSYTYDENGIRTSKTVNGVTTYFNTKDGVILSQTDGTNTLYFQYDTNGIPLGLIWNGTQYFYLTNQMGDVISITDAQGVEIIIYEYDEWGKTYLADSFGNNDLYEQLVNLNPIRYRGYYLDNETGYYYLQSRYYDPSICRFINADEVKYVDINTKLCTNVFAYCINNPINTIDPDGHFIILIIKLVKAILISNILYRYSGSAYIESLYCNSDSHKKVTLHLEKNDFYEEIYKAYKIEPNITFNTLASYAEESFFNRFGRNIIYNETVITKEIRDHIEGYFWTKGLLRYGGGLIQCPRIIYAGALWIKSKSSKKKTIISIVRDATKDTDICEGDYFSEQAIAFGYYYGIRSEYENTIYDPYYVRSSRKRISYSTFINKSSLKWDY